MPERRSAPRASTLREVVFGPLDGVALSLEGVVVDISPEGVGIKTPSPLVPETLIFLEIQPKPGDPHSESVLVRGCVVREQACGSGEYLLGIRMRLAPPANGKVPPSPFRDAAEVGQAVARAITAIQALDAARPLPVAVLVPPREDQPAPHKKRHRHGRGLLLLLLLLSLASLLLLMGKDRPLVAARGVKSIPTGSPSLQEGDGMALAMAGSGALTLLGSEGGPRHVSRMPTLQRAALIDGLSRTPRLQARPRGPEDTTEPPPYGRVVATLEGAGAGPEGTGGGLPVMIEITENLWPEGRPAGAKLPVRDAASPGAKNPDTPVSMDDFGAPASASSRMRKAPGFTAAEDPFEAVAPVADPSRVRLHIDKSDYTLTVLVDDEPVQAFPIGLGKGNSTPEGDFTIANKISNPDWYNHGQVVKAGAPDNPLGDSWMGLGTGGRATSYGIHPTAEPESIGGDQSRGCVRMRPNDARAVFRICPVGARVTIQP